VFLSEAGIGTSTAGSSSCNINLVTSPSAGVHRNPYERRDDIQGIYWVRAQMAHNVSLSLEEALIALDCSRPKKKQTKTSTQKSEFSYE